jgi:universal stress protein E
VLAIPETAREVGADIVVMGAVSRSGLRRVFIGNTAERVLNQLRCDVLVVKPRRFARRVSRRPRGAQLVAPQLPSIF